MKSFWLILATSTLALAQQPDQNLLSLVSAERAFAAATATLGVRDGFLAFFADDAITFEPVLGRYKDALEERPLPTYPLSVLLRWAPEEGDVSASNDIGWLTGPFTVESATPSPEPPPGGWYFSVWKRQKDSTWKVLIDVGIETPPHGIIIDSVQFTPASLHKNGSAGGTPGTLKAADTAFNGMMSGSSPDLKTQAAATVRFHRNGRFPIAGVDEATRYFGSHPYGTASTLSAFVSRSGDLGYTYGAYENSVASGYYVRVWKHTEGRSWKAVLDVTTEKR